MAHHGREFFDACLEVADVLLHAAAPNLLLLKLNDGRGRLHDRADIAARRPPQEMGVGFHAPAAARRMPHCCGPT